MEYPDTSARRGKGSGGGPAPGGARALGWAAALAGALLVLLATARYGPGISPDSTIYLSVAHSLAEGRGFRQFTGEPMVRWAPAYPAVLAPVAAAGLDLPAAARRLNAALFAALVLGAGAWIRRHVPDARLGAIALAAVVLSPALLRVSAYVWSEPLFLLLALLCILDLESFAREGRRGALVRAALWAGAATLTRYAGVSLVAPGLWVVLARRRDPPARRRLDAGLFAGVALAPFAAWLVRNWLVAGSPVGERAVSSYSLLASLSLGLEQLSRWLLPPVVAAPARVALAVAVLTAGAWALARRGAGTREEGAGSAPPWPLAPVAVWMAAYGVLVVAWTSISAVEQLNERYLTPLYLPLVVLGARALVERTRARRRALSAGLATALMLLGLAYPTARTALHLRGYLQEGVDGYGTPAWRQSELARLLRAHPQAQPLFSNAPDAAYFLADVPAKFSPRRTFYNSPQRAEQDLARARESVERAPGKRAYLAWFTAAERPFLYSVADLESVFTVRVETTASDGALYVLESR